MESTLDWARVNDFCRIHDCGKEFSQSLRTNWKQLALKLRSIRRKGGLKEKMKRK
jgi:hypothetical protein